MGTKISIYEFQITWGNSTQKSINICVQQEFSHPFPDKNLWQSIKKSIKICDLLIDSVVFPILFHRSSPSSRSERLASKCSSQGRSLVRSQEFKAWIEMEFTPKKTIVFWILLMRFMDLIWFNVVLLVFLGFYGIPKDSDDYLMGL